MGWMKASEIHCLHVDDVTSFDIALMSLESPEDGVKSLMIRLDPSRLLVIESHRPIGYGARLAPHPGGVVAYVVDTSVDNDRSGEGTGEARSRYAEYLAPNNPAESPRSRGQVDPLITTGGAARFENITVSVIAFGAIDTVRIERD